MIGNIDIFDEDELLAIANDDGESSSSSCHSSVGSEGANDPSRSTAPLAKIQAEELDVQPHGNISLSDGKVDLRPPPSAEQTQTSPRVKDEDEGDGNDDGTASSEDDSDDDDGFLDSWFETEKMAEAARTKSESASHEDDKTDAIVGSLGEHKSSNGHTDDVQKTMGREKNEMKVALGESARRWISLVNASRGGRSITNTTHKASKCQDIDGVVAIENNFEEKSVHQLPPELLLTTYTERPRKRRRAGNDSVPVVLKDISGERSSERMAKQRGQGVYSWGGGSPSTPGAMIDCVAIYDHERGCYILEIVDLTVNNLKLFSETVNKEQMKDRTMAMAEASSGRNPPANAPPELGPRYVAKQAEDQLKRLKRGKGKVQK
ncbi:hypothetical protein ACHAWF_004434 [Thalassiosira exigua]